MNQSALDPHGPVAQAILAHTWLLFATCGVVYVLVIAGLSWALAQKDGATDTHDLDRRMTRVITALTVVTTVTLIALIVASEVNGRSIDPPKAVNAITVDVIGHQWWWEFRYRGSSPEEWFSSPNELHVPVGTPVIIRTQSTDVIHSFWVPNLAGKRDLIPGRTSTMWLQADVPGTYRGQCAEFCGYAHAKMAFIVVAETPQRFAEWTARQRSSAAEASSTDLSRGRELFETRQCALCHAIRGTHAGSHVGPELTHVGSRTMLAAGTIDNSGPMLAAWVNDAPGIKPGVRMPSKMLDAAELRLVVAYLRSLQ